MKKFLNWLETSRSTLFQPKSGFHLNVTNLLHRFILNIFEKKSNFLIKYLGMSIFLVIFVLKDGETHKVKKKF